MREALGSDSFPNVLGDAITRRMVADYRANTSYDIWRQLVTVVPVNDFRTQERTRFGGYGDLPIVAQGDPYASLASPTDEMASYAVAKRGGTEELTIEMIKNDDVGAIRRIPTNLSRAGKRTLAKFVLDILRTNPAIYDTKALFHADHGNLGTLALSAAARASGGTSPTLTVDVQVAGASALSAPGAVTAGAVAEATIATPAVADEAIVTIDLAIDGTTPTWDDIDVLLTLVRV